MSQPTGFGWIGDRSVPSSKFQSLCPILSTGFGVCFAWVVGKFGDVTHAEAANPRTKLESRLRI